MCEAYNYMSYVERGDKNCACHMKCESKRACGSPSKCDLYKAGKFSQKNLHSLVLLLYNFLYGKENEFDVIFEN